MLPKRFDDHLVSPKQKDFFENSNAAGNVVWGGVSSGKSVVASARFAHYIATELQFCDDAVAILAYTRDTIIRNIVYPMLRPLLGDELIIRVAQSELEWRGRKIHIIGGADADSQDKLRGVTLAGCFVDEVTTLHEDFFTMALTRLRTKNPADRSWYPKLFITSNPEHPRHWFKVKYLDKMDELGWKGWSINPDENPHNTAEYKERLKKQLLASGEAEYQRLWEGKWVGREGAIYKMDASMSNWQQGEVLESVVGVDFGIDHPTVFVQIDRMDTQEIVVSRELVLNANKERMSAHQIVKKFVEWWGDRKQPPIYIDPAAAALAAEFQANKIMPWAVEARAVIPGINHISRLLKNGKLKISRNCQFLLAQMQSYAWNKDKSEKGIDEPTKEDDDACDALRYGVQGTFHWWNEAPVETLRDAIKRGLV